MDYTLSAEELKHVNKVLKMMTAITGNPAYVNELKGYGRRPRNMCEVTEGLINKGRLEMQPKIDAAEARAEKAEARAFKAEAENERLRKEIEKLRAQV